ncbi:acyl-CoA dehydrogenase family protein [Erythrobacter sp. EC-HK427]|uniref:acyl-CoA dehydrogenase family protein n=1 Tax=Erythrobacter sp. EC-HK427 TaxID=2038396 RepID=UPI001258D1FC|nr:acyl-CoA dehydrogenase family protein [Erythrobacter sp. EC-HK427]VVT10427.1 Acyl-CoA dehydrogenase [Erythrobacter sp. EC-HK427]
MNFLFNEEQTSLGETVGQVLADFAALTAPDPSRDSEAEVWGALAELGLFSLLVPEEHDGVGLAFVDLAPSIEALGSGLASPLIASTLVATEAIKRLGSSDQRAKLLPEIAIGETAIAIASAELGRGKDPFFAECRLLDGKLSGKKIAVAGADVAQELLVIARTESAPVLVLVPTDAAGVTITAHSDIDPSAGLCRVVFDNVAVAAGQQLARASIDALDTLVDLGATVHSGMAMGIAEVMLRRSVAFASQREQFGKPIGSFQAIKHRCADLAVAVEAGKATSHYAFWACSENSEDRSGAASAAKAYCGEIGCNACNDAIQVHGGMGFTWELGLHRYLRRAQVIEHAVGSRAWHYDRVVTEALAAREVENAAHRDAA